MVRTKRTARRVHVPVAGNPGASSSASAPDSAATSATTAHRRRRNAPTGDWRPVWMQAALPQSRNTSEWMEIYRSHGQTPRVVLADDSPFSGEPCTHSEEVLHWDPRALVKVGGVSFAQKTSNWEGFNYFASDSRLISVRKGPFASELVLPEGIPACFAFCANKGFAAIKIDEKDGAVRFFLRVRGSPEADPWEGEEEVTAHLQMYPMGVLLRWACELARSRKQDMEIEVSEGGDPIEKAGVASEEDINALWVYAAVQRKKCDDDAAQYHHWMEKAGERVLKVVLRPYQVRAVAWMLSRELGPPSRISQWVRIGPERDENGVEFEVDAFGQAVRELGAIGNDDDEDTARGGLLCDAMGLGKTVEFLQLIALNRMPAGEQGSPWCDSNANFNTHRCSKCRKDVGNQPYRPKLLLCAECRRPAHIPCSGTTPGTTQFVGYVCERCCSMLTRFSTTKSDGDMPQSRATLVIVPPTLLRQWVSEVKLHVEDTLRVVIFEGLKETGYIPQAELLIADVVLTTYDALRRDVCVARALFNPTMSLRHAKRYRPTPTPLLGVRWWRVALDEAQMLGSSAGSAVEMVSMLSARFRWCVTGTPLAQSVTDLTQVLKVLNVGLGYQPLRWRQRLVEPAKDGFENDRENLKFALRQLMWRTEKEGLSADELVLPSQQVQFVRTSFGPVEKFHYTRLYERMRDLTLQRLARFGDDISLAKKMIYCLRQACCHPQVGASGQQLIRAGYQSSGQSSSGAPLSRKRRRLDPATEANKRAKNPLTMGEVLDMLVDKAQLEVSEAFRVMVASANGYAGILLLHQGRKISYDGVPIVSAIQTYRELLRLTDKNKEIVKMDKIQLMHVLHNLNEALMEADRLKSSVSGNMLKELNKVGKSIQETMLTEKVEAMKTEYIFAAKEMLAKSMASLAECTSAVIAKANGPHVTVLEEVSEDVPEGVLEEVSEEAQSEPEVDDSADSRPKFTTKRTKRTWWWERAIGIIRETGESELFLERLSSYLLDKTARRNVFSFEKTLANSLTSIPALYSALQRELDELAKARDTLRNRIMKLPGAIDPSADDVSVSGQCGKCREMGSGPECKHCRSEKYVKAVERKLYFIQRAAAVNGSNRRSSRRALDNRFLAEDSDLSSGDEDSDMVFHSAQPRRTMNTKSVTRAMSRALRSSDPKAPTSEQRSEGTRMQSEVEDILSALLGAAKSAMDPETAREAEEYMGHFKALKKEFDACKIAIEAQRNYLAALDEVNMALLRLSVVEDEGCISVLNELQRRFQLAPGMLPALLIHFQHEKTTSERDFQTKRGSLVYLLSLRRSRGANADSYALPEGTTRCPVCLSEFSQDVAILGCGHPFCYECSLELIKKVPLSSGVQKLKCPTCRVASDVAEVNFTVLSKTVNAQGTASPATTSSGAGPSTRPNPAPPTPSPDSIAELDFSPDRSVRRVRPSSCHPGERAAEPRSTFFDPKVRVTGSMGAKLSAIVRVLKTIALRDPGAKALVFSQWAEVLDLISGTLLINGIAHLGRGHSSPKEIGALVEAFRTGPENVLLLPLKRAGAGLNLTEATHVLLVEPSLNPALEAQAIGRVHRIGQTKATVVHRFVVTDSIEDRVLAVAAGRSASDKSVEECVSVEDVRALFARNERVGGAAHVGEVGEEMRDTGHGPVGGSEGVVQRGNLGNAVLIVE